MIKKILFFLFAMAVVIGWGKTVKSELILRGQDNLSHNLVYDTDLDITWYDLSYFAPEYQDAVMWSDQLSVRVGTTEFADWRLPSLIGGKDYNSGSPHHTEVGHLYLIELVNNEVLYPWAFPDKWRYFDNLAGGYYWMLQAKDGNNTGSKGSREAPAYNSYNRKLLFIPVSGVNRPVENRHTFFINKNKYLGVAVHPGDIIRKLQTLYEPSKLIKAE
ncbi:MAG: hypothetical protein MRK02_02195 [Candidatus Scalindua sp.]|nr:hypothetical protein [Candidatus Scalindua sp.]